MSKSADLTRTNHPYIMQSHDICSGSPVLEGTRTRVIDIAIEYTMLGRSPDEIIDAHPYLDLPRRTTRCLTITSKGRNSQNICLRISPDMA